MFITGALSALLPYALFFGILLVFTVQTCATPHRQETSFETPKTLHLEQTACSDFSETIHFFDTLDDIEWDIIQPPDVYPKLSDTRPTKLILKQDHFLASYITVYRTLRAPPLVA